MDLFKVSFSLTEGITKGLADGIYAHIGGAISEICGREFPVPIEYVGVNDVFGESGSPEIIMEKYGLSAHAIARAVKKSILRKLK
ncbi:MAG: hypothetical protein HGA79_09175 [Anaerolineales bacterium]|nr:hypothetical protein [Anaerolineales bacterium]